MKLKVLMFSSSRTLHEQSENARTAENSSSQESPRGGQRETPEDSSADAPSSSTASPRVRRRRGGGEQSTGHRSKRTKLGSNAVPTPGQVGSRSVSVARHGLSRLGRLQEEAWDPPIALLTGHQNSLKCWRNRCHDKYSHLYVSFSTVWKWVTPEKQGDSASKVLIAFRDTSQRSAFLNTVTIPKGTAVTLGSLDSL
nr:MAG: E8^E2 [Gammapapillomavirus sp.]